MGCRRFGNVEVRDIPGKPGSYRMIMHMLPHFQLDRLSALERAAFLLHDVFDCSFGEVAAALGRSEAACRQLASRARLHVREARPFRDAFLYGLVIMVLLFRPQGLFAAGGKLKSRLKR